MFFRDQEQKNQRRWKRVIFKEPIRYHLQEEGRFGGCLGCDLSEGGIRVNFNQFLAVNSEMTVQMKLGSVGKVVALTGRVAWLQRVPYSDRYHVGMKFTNMNPVAQEEIREYIQSR